VRSECALPDDVHIALYRIAQEALNNVVKHAQAGHVEVSLRCPSWPEGGRGNGPAAAAHTGVVGQRYAEVCVQDNGRGFDPTDLRPGELGLQIMRERAVSIGAELEIRSEPGRGTQIRVAWSEDMGPGSEASQGEGAPRLGGESSIGVQQGDG
jgi:signal transduction histidine kinase